MLDRTISGTARSCQIVSNRVNSCWSVSDRVRSCQIVSAISLTEVDLRCLSIKLSRLGGVWHRVRVKCFVVRVRVGVMCRVVTGCAGRYGWVWHVWAPFGAPYAALELESP